MVKLDQDSGVLDYATRPLCTQKEAQKLEARRYGRRQPLLP